MSLCLKSFIILTAFCRTDFSFSSFLRAVLFGKWEQFDCQRPYPLLVCRKHAASERAEQASPCRLTSQVLR